MKPCESQLFSRKLMRRSNKGNGNVYTVECKRRKNKYKKEVRDTVKPKR
jgi:hypothetical protein